MSHAHDCPTCGGYFACEDCDDEASDQRDCYDCLASKLASKLREVRELRAEVEQLRARNERLGRVAEEVRDYADDPLDWGRVRRALAALDEADGAVPDRGGA